MIPSLGSDRLLLKQGDLDGTLHFLIKNKKRQDLKVVLRNNSHRVFQAEFTSIADQYMGEHYELAFSPAVVNYPAFGLATLGLIVKSVTDDPNLASPQATMRCLLVAKVRNSSIKFTFRCEFQFVKPGYESSSCFE